MFGDQDTWWVDVATLKSTLLQFDPSEDHILGGFSEAKANFADHKRIAYGGAGSKQPLSGLPPLEVKLTQLFPNSYSLSKSGQEDARPRYVIQLD